MLLDLFTLVCLLSDRQKLPHGIMFWRSVLIFERDAQHIPLMFLYCPSESAVDNIGSLQMLTSSHPSFHGEEPRTSFVELQGAIAFSGYQYSTSSEAFLGAVKQVCILIVGCASLLCGIHKPTI